MVKRWLKHWKRGVMAAVVVSVLVGVALGAVWVVVDVRGGRAMTRLRSAYADRGLPTDEARRAGWFAVEEDAVVLPVAEPRRGVAVRVLPGSGHGDAAAHPLPTHAWPATHAAAMRWVSRAHDDEVEAAGRVMDEGAWRADGAGVVIGSPGVVVRWSGRFADRAVQASLYEGPDAALVWVHRMLDLADAVAASGDEAAPMLVVTLVARAVALVEDELSRAGGVDGAAAWPAAGLRVLAGRLDDAGVGPELGGHAAADLVAAWPELAAVEAQVRGPDPGEAWSAYWLAGEPAFDTLGEAWGELPDEAEDADASLWGLRGRWVMARGWRRFQPAYFSLRQEAAMRGVFEACDALVASEGDAAARLAWCGHGVLLGNGPAGDVAMARMWRMFAASQLSIRDRARVAAAALRLEAARLDAGGAWAETLVASDELNTAWGTDVLGRPWRVKRTADGWLVYGLGLNGVDEGGRQNRASPHALPGRDAVPWSELGRMDDPSFRLYDAGVRGQPAAAWPPWEVPTRFAPDNWVVGELDAERDSGAAVTVPSR